MKSLPHPPRLRGMSRKERNADPIATEPGRTQPGAVPLRDAASCKPEPRALHGFECCRQARLVASMDIETAAPGPLSALQFTGSKYA